MIIVVSKDDLFRIEKKRRNFVDFHVLKECKVENDPVVDFGAGERSVSGYRRRF